MRRALVGTAAALILGATAAASPALAISAPSTPDAAGPATELIKDGSGPAVQACGAQATPNGSGGWLLFWTNCWANYTRPIAPSWSNGQGNQYVNIACHSPLANGQTAVWNVPAAALPPEPATFNAVVFCLP